MALTLDVGSTQLFSLTDLEDMPRLPICSPCPYKEGTTRCSECDLHKGCVEAIHQNSPLDIKSTDNGRGTPSSSNIPQIQEDAFEILKSMELANDPDYKHVEQYGVSIHYKKTGPKNWIGIASAIIPNTTPKEFLNIYWNLEKRKEWDSFFSDMTVVERFCDGSELIYMASWAPPLITRRDFVQVRRFREEDKNNYMAVFLPAETEQIPPKKGLVRGVVNFSGFTLRLAEGGSRFTLMTNTDVGVAIPEWIVKRLMNMGAKVYFEYIKNAIAKAKNQGNQ